MQETHFIHNVQYDVFPGCLLIDESRVLPLIFFSCVYFLGLKKCMQSSDLVEELDG